MERYNVTRKVGIFGIIGNLFLLIIKLIFGFISSSQSMVADAFNSASDIFASFMTSIGNKIASVPKDDNHNFGHGKAEYIFSMLISLSMMGISLKIFYDGFRPIINNNKIEFSWWLIIVCMLTIVIKLFLYIYTQKVYIDYPNILLKTNMMDHRNDCIITLFTTLSIVFGKYGVNFVDGIIGMGISAWIFMSGTKIFMESYNVLMDISIDEETKSQILEIIKEYSLIEKVPEIYSVPTGYKYIIVLTIELDGRMSTFDSHQIADELELKITSLISRVERVMIHVHPTLNLLDSNNVVD